MLLFIPQIFAPKWCTDNLLPVLLRNKGLMVWYHLLLLPSALVHFGIRPCSQLSLQMTSVRCTFALNSASSRSLWSGFLEQLIEVPGLAWIDALKSIIKSVFLSTMLSHTQSLSSGASQFRWRDTHASRKQQQPAARWVLQALWTERAHSCQVWKVGRI